MVMLAKPLPSVDWVRQYFAYDPDTGHFTWIKPTCIAARMGRRVGTPDKDGYLRMRAMGIRFYAHRAAWAFIHGDWPPRGMQIDHINGDPSDNRACNLRLADNSQQQFNTRRRAHGASGLRGVVRDTKTGTWRAQIMQNKKQTYLGTFTDKDVAHQAYLSAARKMFGEFVDSHQRDAAPGVGQ